MFCHSPKGIILVTNTDNLSDSEFRSFVEQEIQKNELKFQTVEIRYIWEMPNSDEFFIEIWKNGKFSKWEPRDPEYDILIRLGKAFIFFPFDKTL